MKINLNNIRREYRKSGLNENGLPDNPLVLVEQWLEEAIKAQVNEPTAMLVGTVSEVGRPATRTVLLKEINEGKLLFYTNYNSRKGLHLAHNPAISLTFVWHELERQVHIEGLAAKVPAEVSDAYFKTRPYKSRIGARISPQSQPIPNRMSLVESFIREAARYAMREVERPDNWGGYAVTPDRVEFWQGRPNRLHDRILYTLQADGGDWWRERLAP